MTPLWIGLDNGAKGRRLRDMAAALRAIGHLPATKVQTRGEVVAEMMVTLTTVVGYRFHFHSAPDGATGQVIPAEPSTEHLRWVRQYIADWIDAERQSARDEALDEAARVAGNSTSTGDSYDVCKARHAAVSAILNLKGPR